MIDRRRLLWLGCWSSAVVVGLVVAVVVALVACDDVPPPAPDAASALCTSAGCDAGGK